MIKVGLVDEVRLTLAPVLFGGRNAPTLADGPAPEFLSGAKRFRLQNAFRRGQEMFLSYVAIG